MFDIKITDSGQNVFGWPSPVKLLQKIYPFFDLLLNVPDPILPPLISILGLLFGRVTCTWMHCFKWACNKAADFENLMHLFLSAICWDQWFPEAARAMVLQGAEILFYPTAIGSEPQDEGLDSRDHWKRVMQGHAGANLVSHKWISWVIDQSHVQMQYRTKTFSIFYNYHKIWYAVYSFRYLL